MLWLLLEGLLDGLEGVSRMASDVEGDVESGQLLGGAGNRELANGKNTVKKSSLLVILDNLNTIVTGLRNSVVFELRGASDLAFLVLEGGTHGLAVCRQSRSGAALLLALFGSFGGFGDSEDLGSSELLLWRGCIAGHWVWRVGSHVVLGHIRMSGYSEVRNGGRGDGGRSKRLWKTGKTAPSLLRLLVN